MKYIIQEMNQFKLAGYVSKIDNGEIYFTYEAKDAITFTDKEAAEACLNMILKGDWILLKTSYFTILKLGD